MNGMPRGWNGRALKFPCPLTTSMTTRVVIVVPTRIMALFVKLRVVVLTVPETVLLVDSRLLP